MAADSVAKALVIVRDKLTFLIVRELFFGVTRFTDLEKNLGVARNVLSKSLKRMLELGLVKRKQYNDRPPQFSYHFTDKGRDLFGITVALMESGDRWLVAKPPPVLELTAVAVAYGVGPETLRNWVNKYREAHGGTETEVTLAEQARLNELERENSELHANIGITRASA